MKSRFAGAIAVCCLGFSQVHAYTTVGEILPACQLGIPGQSQNTNPDDKQLVDMGYCAGMLDGIVNMMNANCSSIIKGFSPSGAFSANAFEMSEKQVTVFVRWALANPDQWDEPFVGGAVTAFRDLYPCNVGQ